MFNRIQVRESAVNLSTQRVDNNLDFSSALISTFLEGMVKVDHWCIRRLGIGWEVWWNRLLVCNSFVRKSLILLLKDKCECLRNLSFKVHSNDRCTYNGAYLLTVEGSRHLNKWKHLKLFRSELVGRIDWLGHRWFGHEDLNGIWLDGSPILAMETVAAITNGFNDYKLQRNATI